MPSGVRCESPKPPHLPALWPDQAAYDRLYRHIDPIGDYSESDQSWREIRIHGGATAEEVYQRLPSTADGEFGGYLTRTRIRYRACDRNRSWMPGSKVCTFHSHPTRIGRGEPDLPSASDIRHFLLSRNWRTITVGRSILWVWDKTHATLDAAHKLAAWERTHMVRVTRRLLDEGMPGWEDSYLYKALGQLGLKVPTEVRVWGRTWPQALRRTFGFKVTVLERRLT